jgi:acyl-CoA synthetase (AMP-forming)/AMP-acid ligase II
MRAFVKAKVDFFSSERKEDHVHSLPELIDFNSVHNPDHLFCIQARSNAPFINVTNAQFKIAVDQCAQWIANNVKLSSVATKNGLAEKPPVALLMESDFGLIVHQFALISLGIQVRELPFPLFSCPLFLRDLIVTASCPFRTP